MVSWSTYEMHRAGQTNWLARLYEKTLNGIRANGGIGEDLLTVQVPTLDEQARAMRYEKILPPGHNPPSGILDWLD